MCADQTCQLQSLSIRKAGKCTTPRIVLKSSATHVVVILQYGLQSRFLIPTVKAPAHVSYQSLQLLVIPQGRSHTLSFTCVSEAFLPDVDGLRVSSARRILDKHVPTVRWGNY